MTNDTTVMATPQRHGRAQPATAKMPPSFVLRLKRRAKPRRAVDDSRLATDASEQCKVKAIRPWRINWHNPTKLSTIKRGTTLAALIIAAGGALAPILDLPARAAPAPEAEYAYDVMVRRHYNFPNNDAIGYGYAICDKVTTGESYAQVMSDVKTEVTPNDEFAANYLVSYAVNLLCPTEIWQLRNSAAHYQPPRDGSG